MEISIWLILIGSFIGGYHLNGIGGSLLVLFVAFIFCVVIFGAFLVIVDIQKSIRAIENYLKTKG
jgi:hypothetical protein